jgi:disulfide bond formation protein DsbB
MSKSLFDTLGDRLAAVSLIVISATVLASAYGSQFIGGLQPCPLCLYQRIPWWVALGLAALALRLHPMARWRDGAVLLGAFAVLLGAGLAAYHAGVEYTWWAGPTTCSGGGDAPNSLDALRAQILAAPVVRCDEAAWTLFGVSMAGYNFIVSLIVGLGVAAATRMKHKG